MDGNTVKILKFAFILLSVFLVIGCAHTYNLTENWVDEDDLQQILKTPEIQKNARQLGTPVFTEYRGDTVEFIYNYKPHLYRSSKDGREYKPNDEDRLDVWSERTEFVGLLVVGERIVGIRPRPDYQAMQKTTQAKSSTPAWIVILGIVIVAGVATPILLLN